MEGLPVQAVRREERLSDRVAKQLEDLIVTGVLETGKRLPAERELAEMFGVSRTVIREAVHNLSARDLLDARSSGGTFVSGPTTDSVVESLRLLLRFRAGDFLVEHLHEVRRFLEVEIAARAAVSATEEDIADMENILRVMEEGKADHDASANLDVEFHQALAVATHNPLFIILLDSIGDLLLEIRYLALQDPETVHKALYHHRNVLEKVKIRDANSARRAMAAHVDQSEDTMRRILKARGQSHSIAQLAERPSGEVKDGGPE